MTRQQLYLWIGAGAIAAYYLGQQSQGSGDLVEPDSLTIDPATGTVSYDPTSNLFSSVASDPVSSVLGLVGGLVSFNARTLSARGEAFIKHLEGLKLHAYPDARGYSDGYGHFGVSKDAVVTQAEADANFETDKTTFENFVNNLVNVDLNQDQFDALVSFTYNAGGGQKGLAGSTLLRLVNAGDFAGAADQFGRWIHKTLPGGEVVVDPGLVDRRNQERALFESQL